MKRSVCISVSLALAMLSSLSCIRNENIVLEPDVDVAVSPDMREAILSPLNQTNGEETNNAPSQGLDLDLYYQISEPIDLFNGKTLDGWTAASGGSPKGWSAKDGILSLVDPEGGSDIITNASYSSYIFSFEWRFGIGCNSGVKYKIESPNGKDWVGLEYQIQDDANVEDGKISDRRTASLFDVLPAAPSSKSDNYPTPTTTTPGGDFRHGKIVVANSRIEHWLDDELVLSFEIGSSEWNEAKKDSKFKNQQRFGQIESSPILLQSHGYPIDFRNLKLQRLEPISDN